MVQLMRNMGKRAIVRWLNPSVLGCELARVVSSRVDPAAHHITPGVITGRCRVDDVLAPLEISCLQGHHFALPGGQET